MGGFQIYYLVSKTQIDNQRFNEQLRTAASSRKGTIPDFLRN
jgi:hypothetical protein